MLLEASPWLGQGWLYKEATHMLEKMHTLPHLSLYTNTPAHCFPTAGNHINSEFGIHVSFC